MKLTLYHLKMPLVSHFETSFGRTYHHECLIVRLERKGISGWGECPASTQPDYSYETVNIVWNVIVDFLAPLISKGDRFIERFSVVRGHEMAKAAIEMAYWDLDRREKGISLAELYTKQPRKEIESGISLGIQDKPADLIKRIANSLDKKYRRIKIKIKPSWDINILKLVRKEFPDIKLMADANGAYTMDDVATLKKLDDFNLMMVEQPMWYDDYVIHARLARKIKTPIALDEPIRTARDAENAISLGSCDVINIKQSRVGGPSEARRIHDICQKNKIPVFCGGLLETGIGRLHNIALASMPNCTLPGDISESARYYVEDIIDPVISLTSNGTIHVPDRESSYKVNKKALAKYCLRKKSI